jgi:flagellar export protein FliJ
MKRDPLAAVLRLRRLAMEDATRDFAECLRSEAEAAQAVAAVEAAITSETEVASSLEAGDAVVEAFGAWLKRARKDLRAAQAVYEQSENETARARAAVAVARASLKATENLIAEREAAADLEEARQEQRELDEIGRKSRE